MAHLRKPSAILPCWALLASLCFGAQKDDTKLKSLYDSHQWFELRDSIRKGGAPPFYQGVVACAFNDARRCEKRLGDLFNSAPRSDEAVEAHRILASAYFTHGEYKKALAQEDAILALRPTDADALSDRPVFSPSPTLPTSRSRGDKQPYNSKTEDCRSQSTVFTRHTGSTRERSFLY